MFYYSLQTLKGELRTLFCVIPFLMEDMSIFYNPGPLLNLPKNGQVHKGLEWKVTLASGLVQQPKHFLARL